MQYTVEGARQSIRYSSRAHPITLPFWASASSSLHDLSGGFILQGMYVFQPRRICGCSDTATLVSVIDAFPIHVLILYHSNGTTREPINPLPTS
jgi:hypothetical protein